MNKEIYNERFCGVAYDRWPFVCWVTGCVLCDVHAGKEADLSSKHGCIGCLLCDLLRMKSSVNISVSRHVIQGG